MSFQNSGTTPSGRRFFRGEPIIVLHLSHQITGHIAEISESDGEIYVTANLLTGVLNSMGGEAADGPGGKQVALPGKFPPVEYVGTGFRHQSTRLVRGEAGTSKGMRVFCFADETPNFAMGDAPGTAPATPPLVTVDVTEGNDPPLAPPAAGKEFHPADTDKDHVVSKKEQKKFDKEHGK